MFSGNMIDQKKLRKTYQLTDKKLDSHTELNLSASPEAHSRPLLFLPKDLKSQVAIVLILGQLIHFT